MTGIVVLNYNDSKTTIDFLKQIKDYKIIDTIVIVDNNSTDNSFQVLSEYSDGEKVYVINNDSNKGYASGNNVGINYLNNMGEYDYVIISNPDIEVNEDCIKTLIKDFDDNALIVSPVINEHGVLSKGWKIPKFSDDLVSNLIHSKKMVNKRLNYPEEYYDKKIVSVDVTHGCFFIANNKLFKKLGYFDEGTFLYYEENIIAKKAKEKKYDILLDTRVTVNHNCSVSIDKSIKALKKYKILKKSQKYYELKYNKINIFQLFILRFVYYITYIISFIIHLFR